MTKEAIKMFMDLVSKLHSLIRVSSDRNDLSILICINNRRVRVVGWRSEWEIPEIKIEVDNEIEYIFVAELNSIENVLYIIKELDTKENFEKYLLKYTELKSRIIEEIKDKAQNKSIDDLLYLLTNDDINEI